MNATETRTYYPYGEREVKASELRVGDTIHHFSPTGGTWSVTNVHEGHLRLVSDRRAVRRMGWAELSSRTIYLASREAEVVADYGQGRKHLKTADGDFVYVNGGTALCEDCAASADGYAPTAEMNLCCQCANDRGLQLTPQIRVASRG